MLVAVEETATGAGKAGETRIRGRAPGLAAAGVALRRLLPAALLALVPMLAFAQIVAGGAHAPNVIQTPNGLDQVNINRPSGAGVSVNTYNRLDVPSKGAILNNSPVIVQTQQGGVINGNPNFAAGQSAKIIVNQVNSASASQLNGYLEVAGNRAEVVIANPSGISVNGGGFINTSRAILTTGTPNYGADGSLTGFSVTGGNITVTGAGMNASNVDQVDLLARAVQANAAIYAKNLNVIAGANSIDHDTLNTTPVAGDGLAPGLSIDVSNLGGMYANRIVLVGTESGVGVSLKGVAAANAGDLVLQSNGQLVLGGTQNASGNISASARDGIDNSGTTYAQQNVSVSTSGTLSNSGMVAAQQNTAINAGAVNSTGTLAAGVNGDGSLARSGDLNVNASGTVTTTGRNVAGGNASIGGAALNLAGSTTSANGAISLAANGVANGGTNGGDLNLSGATTTAGSALNARAGGTLTNDHGAMSSGGAQTVTAGALSNRSGQIVSGGALTENVSAATNNSGGTMQANGALSATSGSLDNTGGHVASLNADGVNMTTTGLLNNGAGGAIGGNGSVALQAGQIANAGSLTAVQSLIASAAQTLFNSGTLAANANMTLAAGSTLTNAGQIGAAGALALSAATFDNSGGTASASQFTLHAANLVNRAGSITQTGTGTTTLDVTGTLDNSAGGTLQTGSTDLTIAPATLDNDGGTITHAGKGTLTVNAGAVSNVGGKIVTNGKAAIQAATFSNAAGSVNAQNGLAATVAGALDNANGKLLSNTDLSLASGTLNNNGGQLGAGTSATVRAGSLTNSGGSMVAPNLSATTTGTLDNSGGNIEANQLALGATDLLNRGGTITQYGTPTMGFNVSGTFDNSAGGTLQTNSTDFMLAPATLDNDGGTITHAGKGTLTVNAGAVSNANGKIVTNGKATIQAGTLNNTAGSVNAQNGLSAAVAGALDNANGKLLSNADLSLASGTLNNNGGQIGAGTNATVRAGSLTNSGGSMVAPNLSVTTTGTLDNSGGNIEANQLALGATDLLNHGGTITQYGTPTMGFNISGTFDNSNGGTLQANSIDLTIAPATLDNDGGKILHAGTGTLTLTPGNGAGALSNAGGQIITAGQLAAQAGSLNNANGILAAQGKLAANIAGDANNTQGAIRALGSASLTTGGTLTNTNGQIQSGTGAAGDASTLAIQAASVGNTNGLVGNLGAGDTTIQAANQIGNSGGVMTGNGNVSVDTSALVNTQNGQVSGANVAIQADTVDNSAGRIGSFSGSNGDVTVNATGAVTNTNGQIGATHNLSVNAAALTGGGAYSAANDVAVSVQGDFAPTPDLQFAAGHDLTFTLPGTFTNGATLEAANNLGINAGDIENTGVMMAGGTLATHSNTLTNTGAMIGGSVSLNANSTIANVGASALIGATDSNGTLELLAQDIENRDDTTATDTQATTAIYGLGKVVLAGGKDANGNYTNANLIRNQSALIESAGDMELRAGQVTNTRTTMTTTGLNQPVDPVLIDSLGISLSGCISTNMAACAANHPFVGWINGNDGLIGGVPVDPPHGGQWNSGWQYTTYTGVAVANLIAGLSPQAQIVAGGNLDASNVGMFQNYWSAVTAAGNIAAPVSLDQNSWQGQSAPEVQVTYSGEYHYRNYDGSIADWTLPFGDAPFTGSHPGGYTQAAPADIRYYLLPGYESSFVAGGTLSGSGISIDNTAGNAGIPSMGLAPGQAMSGVTIGGLSGNAGGATSGASSVTGNASGAKSGAASVNGGSRTVDPAIASATAQNVLQNLTVPQGGLFRPTTTPGATYLIEGNPAFTNAKTFISSDYYLQQLGLNPQTTEKRLGDGMYEQQLVRNQVTALTGKAVLGPYTDIQSMYQSMLAAGASLAQSLNLPLGMSLSAEQVAQLTGNVIIMQTEVVDGQSVLVPVVYLAKASQQNMNGPLIAATDIDIQNAQTFTNSGTVQAGNTLSIQGSQINNAFGTLQSGGLMSLTTAGNVDLTSATVNAGSLALVAGGDVLLNTAVKTVDQVSATGATRTTTTLGPVANLNVAGNAAIVTGGNFEQNAANLNVGGNLGMAVGGNYDIGSVQTGEHKVVERANGVSNTSINQTTGSSINVGGVSQIGVGGDLTATGANINLGGGGVVAANGNVTLQAAKATSTVDSNSAGSDSHGSYSESKHTSDDTLTATTLNAGNSLTVASGKDIDVTGSALTLDKGTATLAATGNVNIGAVTETHVENGQEQHSHSNVVSGKQVQSSSDTTATLSQGSLVSADAVQIAGGRDINVAGSTIAGTNDVALSAEHDVNITTTQDTVQSSSTYQEKRTGLGTSGLTVTVGTNKLATTSEQSSVTNNASTVGSINGDLSIQAGNTLHVTGSDLVAGGNLAGTAANVIIDAATDSSHQAQTQKQSSSGLAIGLAGSVGDAINNAYSESQAAKSSTSTGNDRAAALHGIAAASDILTAAGGAMTTAAGKKTDIGIQVSIGSSKSQSQSSEDQTTQRGTSIQAGGTAGLIATNGDLTIAGSNVNANDVVLAAKNQVNVINTTDTDSMRSSNSSSSASVGVQASMLGGFGVSAAMANAHGDANSDASIQNASHVTGANSVTVVSGGDTNITGSQISGKQINADVGGNLNIVSVQDVTNSAAHQSSAGGGVTISQGGGSASFSAQNGHADSNYAGVNEQAGIYAGNGGFNVNVKGNTGLSGAVIASTADASKNSLTTGTLTYSDIENQSHYSANSNGISAGAGVGNTGKSVGPGSVSNGGGISPMLPQNASGDQSGTTRSAVSAGTITVTDTAHQTQNVAGLSRDTTDTNGKVANTPDVNALLNQQADRMNAAQAAGQAVAQRIGDYANAQEKATGDPEWAEGGNKRAAMQAAGAAVVAGLGGGVASAVEGAAGAAIGSKMGRELNKVSDSIAASNPTGDANVNQALGNIVANVIATGAGAAAGGAGAFSSSDVDRYNRQLHPEEKTLAKQLADKSGGKYTQAQIQDQMRIMGVSDNGTSESGAPTTLIGQAPTDSGAKWISGGTTANGQPILTQVTAQADPALQSYILSNYNSASSGQVPSQFTYQQTGSGSMNVTGPFTKFDQSDAQFVRSTAGAVAGFGATQLDRTAAFATAFEAAGSPIPYVSVSAGTIAVGATFGSWLLNGVQQAATPNTGNYAVSTAIGQMTGALSNRYPVAAPVINEFGNITSNSGQAQNAQEWVNNNWSKLIGHFQ
ncbi:beta strand repeat-containing protein [Paraburkholderia sp. J41]|uniref:beta strand repeat-containing protein n=1 Tax=Paraburkholderia sp. J41 TaxID=2805433 RepID=UPI0039F4731D